MGSVAKKVVIVTGGATGIGQAIVRRFLQEGALVTFCDLDQEAGDRLVQECRDREGAPRFFKTDVTNKQEVQALVQHVLGQEGRIDVLINNAGTIRDGLSATMSEEDFNTVLTVNLTGTFLCCQAAFEPMKAQRSGRMLTTSSVSALGNVGQVNYAASKAGIIGLTKTLALEYARYTITVNCVAPGFTETRMTSGLPDKVRDLVLSKIPFRRMAAPSDIAAAHLFLASDDASYITGQVLFVDGGLSVGF